MVGSSIARNEKGQIVGMDWGEALGADVIFGTELKNAAFALDRR